LIAAEGAELILWGLWPEALLQRSNHTPKKITFFSVVLLALILPLHTLAAAPFIHSVNFIKSINFIAELAAS